MHSQPTGQALAPVLTFEQLRFAWPQAAQDLLRVDSLVLRAGEQLLIRGNSGRGKSTLLALAAGVLLPSQGQVRLLGQSWAALRPAQRDAMRASHIGYIFQQFNVLPYLNALANVMLPCQFSSRRASQLQASSARQEAARLLQALDLPPSLWTQPTGQLSVGQQQRVAAARALIGKPALIIADEPTSALDENRRDQFMRLLQGECQASGSALLLVSHDARLAEHFAQVLDLDTLAQNNFAERPQP